MIITTQIRRFLQLSGILLLFMIFFISCSLSEHNESQHPTFPSDLNTSSERFGNISARAVDDYGVYSHQGLFFIRIPTGDYLLTYTTGIGTFDLVFRATQTSIFTIGLQPDDSVQKAILYPGTISSSAEGTPDGTVTVFWKPGDGGSWTSIFTKDPDATGVVMVGGVSVNYVPGEVFDLHISKAGTYLLTYITQIGKFEHEFTIANDNSIYPIGLTPGDTVKEAYILKK